MVIDGPHQHQAVDNHYYYHANILGESEEELSEIVAFHGGLLAVKASHLAKAAEERHHVVAPEAKQFVVGDKVGAGKVIEHHGQHHVAVGAYHTAEGKRGFQAVNHRIYAVAVAAVMPFSDGIGNHRLDKPEIAVADYAGHLAHKVAHKCRRLHNFVFVKISFHLYLSLYT